MTEQLTEETRHPHDRWRDVVDAAQRSLHARRCYERIILVGKEDRLGQQDMFRAEWDELVTRQENDPDGDETRHRRERAELFDEQEQELERCDEAMYADYEDAVAHQPPGWEDTPELAAEIEQMGGLSYYEQAAFEAHQREDRLQRQAGRSPPVDHGRDRGGLER